MDKRIVTFIIIFLATISSLINDIGYVFLIPLSAIIFQANNRNPFAGIVAAFCGVSFGSAISLFVGSMEVNLIPYTTSAARLIDKSTHISLTSNLIIIIAFSVLLSILFLYGHYAFILFIKLDFSLIYSSANFHGIH